MSIAVWSLVFAVVAAAAALAAAVIAALERRARRRQTFQRFSVRRIGWVDDAGDGARAEVIEVTQYGTVSALIITALLVGGTTHLTDDRRMPEVMLPGQGVKLNVRSDNLAEAFIVIVWLDVAWRRGTVEWHPIDHDGPLFDEVLRQMDEMEAKRRWPRSWLPANWPSREQRRVGPGGVLRRNLPRPGRDLSGDSVAKMLPEGKHFLLK